MARALAGTRVLDFTHVLAGPFATHQLAVLGADVIKVEKRGGEDNRFNPVHPEWAAEGYAPSWVAVNAGKRSLTLDLKRPEAREVIARLAARADVVVENFRPGVMASLGLGWDDLSAANPRLVYCSISGFGHTGPERGTAAFDGMIQAMSGVMSMTGDPAGGPMRVGFPLADVATGLTAALAITGALLQRVQTGRGQFVDVAMLDATVSLLASQVAEYTLGGRVQPQLGNLSVSRKPTADLFPTGEGRLLLAVLTDGQFARLLDAVGRADALDDPRFADWPARMANAAALRELLVAALAARPARDWAQRLKAADVPCGCVAGLDEVVASPQLAHRDVLQRVDGPKGPMTLVGPGYVLGDGGAGIDRAAPRVGEHVDEVLREAGYDEAGIRRLREAGVV